MYFWIPVYFSCTKVYSTWVLPLLAHCCPLCYNLYLQKVCTTSLLTIRLSPCLCALNMFKGKNVQAHCLSGYSHYPPPHPPAQLPPKVRVSAHWTHGRGAETRMYIAALVRGLHWFHGPSLSQLITLPVLGVRLFLLTQFVKDSPHCNTLWTLEASIPMPNAAVAMMTCKEPSGSWQ